MAKTDEYLKPTELVERWGGSELTLRDWRTKGKGPKYTKLKHNGRIMYALSDIEAFEKENGMEEIVKARFANKVK